MKWLLRYQSYWYVVTPNCVAQMRAKFAQSCVRPADCRWLIAVVVLAALPTLAADTEVHWANGRLSVKASGEPLGTVLHEIARQTGVVIKGADALSEPVVSDFDQVPLAEGFRRLLKGKNYLIVEKSRKLRSQPAVTRVFVLTTPTVAASAEGESGSVSLPAEHIGVLDTALGEEEHTAETILRRAASAGDRDVQRVALDLLGHLNTSSARLAVVEHARSADPEERMAALKVLTTVDPAGALPELNEALGDRDPGVRSGALELLATMMDPAVGPLLERALADADPAIRIATVEFLGRRGDESSLALIHNALSDRNEAVRAVAADLVNPYQEGG